MSAKWTWTSQPPLPPHGEWCWVSDGEDVWIAMTSDQAAGGWTNEDTWEDFDRKVRYWQMIERPEPPL